MATKTQKETIEYNQAFLDSWNTFCDRAGYVKRTAAHACRAAFMELPPAEREKIIAKIAPTVISSRSRNQK